MSTTSKHGIEVLQDPNVNKSTSFTEPEKQALDLVGLVPDATETEDLQLQRVLLQLSQKHTDLDRYIYLVNLLDHDETLFYRTSCRTPCAFYQSSMTRRSARHASSSDTSIGKPGACTSR